MLMPTRAEGGWKQTSIIRIIIDNKIILILSIAVILLHIILHGNFRKESMDDPWVLSWAYNYLYHGITYDYVFSGEILGSGLQLFGKTYAYIYGYVLHFVGFTQSNAHLISKILLFIAAYFWFKILTFLKFKKELVVTLVMLMLLLEPYVGFVQQTLT